MIGSLNSAISGMKTAFTRSDVSAHDVANVNTQGYSERDFQQKEKPNLGGSEPSSMRKIANPSAEFSNTDIATETVQRMASSYDVKANAATIRTQDEMLGELLDLKA